MARFAQGHGKVRGAFSFPAAGADANGTVRLLGECGLHVVEGSTVVFGNQELGVIMACLVIGGWCRAGIEEALNHGGILVLGAKVEFQLRFDCSSVGGFVTPKSYFYHSKRTEEIHGMRRNGCISHGVTRSFGFMQQTAKRADGSSSVSIMGVNFHSSPR